MNALDRHCAEIKRLKEAQKKSESNYLKTDYGRKIKKMVAELKTYCGYRGLNFEEVANGFI